MIDALVSHLAANCPTFVTVALALSSEPIDSKDDECPAAYLYIQGETASLSDTDGFIVQEITRTIAVFVVGKHADMMDLRAELRGEILGYQPDSYHTALELVSGDSVAIRGEWQWWQDLYQTRTHYRQA